MSGGWKDHQLIALRQKIDEDYKPDQEQLMEYAKHIGMHGDDVLVQELLYLAYQGIQAKLPNGWEACKAPDQAIVYRNKLTREVIEEHPLDQVYRQKVTEQKMMLAEGSESEGSGVVREELSAISEQENQLRNESEIFERKRYYAPQQVSKNMLREGLSKQGFRHMMEIDNYSAQNSALDRNISSREANSNYQGTQNTKILPSSLLNQVPSLPLQGGLEQYLTVLTQAERDDRDDKSYISKSQQSQEGIIEERRQKLQELQRQKVLKLQLLSQLRQSNEEKALRLRKRLKKRGRKDSKV